MEGYKGSNALFCIQTAKESSNTPDEPGALDILQWSTMRSLTKTASTRAGCLKPLPPYYQNLRNHPCPVDLTLRWLRIA